MKYGGHGNASPNKTEIDFCKEIQNPNTITADNANTKYKDSTHEDVTSYLTCAAKSGSVDICQKLIDNGANVNFQDNTGKTALMHAAMSGSVVICKILIDNGANVNARDNTGKTALMHMVQFPLSENEDNKIKCFNLLIENGASFDNTIVDEFKKSTFYMACENFMIEYVELLFSKGYEMSENDKNVLFSVIGNFAFKIIPKMNKIEKLKKFLIFLLDHGASATGTTKHNPIEFATDHKLTEIADLLKHKPILDSLERAEFEVKNSDGTVSIEESIKKSKEKLRDLEKQLGINDKSINEIEGDYLKKIKSFIKAYILLKGGKRIKNKRSNKNKRSQNTKSRKFRKTRHRSRV